MNRVVTPKVMQAWDADCIRRRGISAQSLMLTAAEGVFDAALRHLTDDQTVTCICGSGNNGGDGFAAAWLLKRAGRSVRIIFVGNVEKLSKESRFYLESAKEENVPILSEWEETERELLIDAIFGIGLDRPVLGAYRALIERMNGSKKTIISVDIPSGLHAQTGYVMGIAVRATETVTMQFVKQGHLLGEGRRYTGILTVHPLASDDAFAFSEEAWLQTKEEIETLLPSRPFDSHKGKNGHSLLIVGSDRYHGAAVLSAKACLRAGTGLLTVLTVDAVRHALDTVPEAITASVGRTWRDADTTVSAHLDRKSAIGIGCGIGEGDIAQLLASALALKCPLVLDADALNELSRHRELLGLLHEKVVLTPHPGEMARLLNCSVEEVLEAPTEAGKQFPCTVLLKGATTVIRKGERVCYSVFGNAGLAKGGSGDVLTGIIVALLAQGLKPFDAARAGAYLLGAKADEAFRLLGERMLLATDLMDVLS